MAAQVAGEEWVHLHIQCCTYPLLSLLRSAAPAWVLGCARRYDDFDDYNYFPTQPSLKAMQLMLKLLHAMSDGETTWYFPFDDTGH